MERERDGSSYGGVSRRRFLWTSAAAAASAACIAEGWEAERASASTIDASKKVPFYGRHQAGIATPPQDALCFAAFDLAPQSKPNLRDVFRALTRASFNLTRSRK